MKFHTSNQSKKSIVPTKKILLSIIGSICLLFFYFYDQDWLAIFKAAEFANLPLAIGSFFSMVICHWLIEVYFRGMHFTWFFGSFPWREYFWMKGALYLVLIINGPLSAGARVLYLVKKTNISWTLYFGLGFFRLVLVAGVVAIIMLLASYPMMEKKLFELSGIPPIYWFIFIAWNLLVLLDVYMAFYHKKYIGLSRLFKNKVDHEFFTAFKRATHLQWIWTFCVGSLPLLILIVFYWLMAYAFGIKIPIWYFSICMAFVLILSNLPLTFGGFGTTTMAWFLFFDEYADEALLLSFTLFLPIARLLVYGTVGLLCLKPALKDFFELLSDTQQGNHPKEQAKQEIKSIFLK